ncbi:hypothetical protein FACS189452_08800 [Bacteroidia bacterium]|nr:hypothetical protein FACS189452_08800 [Bacteroidia bacterium]
MFVWVFASCEKLDHNGIDFDSGKRDGVYVCNCIWDAQDAGIATKLRIDNCFRDNVNTREVERMQLNGEINDYVAGLITSSCVLPYLLDNGYMPDYYY